MLLDTSFVGIHAIGGEKAISVAYRFVVVSLIHKMITSDCVGPLAENAIHV